MIHIPTDFQNVIFRGEKLPVVDHPLESIQLGEELRVKHNELRSWMVLLECESSFQQAVDPVLKKTIHVDSEGLIENLTQSQFFRTYPTLIARRHAIEKKCLTYFDRKIKDSCQIHFEKIYGKSIELLFESREDGSRSGCLCIVKSGSLVVKYYIKTHHGARDKSSNTRADIDLKELFVYKLLEGLRVEPKTQFINNEMYSKWMVYIGSQEIPNFKTLVFVELSEVQNIKEYSKCVVQMLFIYSILMLGDYHAANMGLDNCNNSFIVNFTIIGKPLSSVKDHYENVRISKKFNETLDNFDERLKISLDYLKESTFLTILENSVESFLQYQKPIFDKSLLVFGNHQKANDFQEYVENMKRNVKLFNDYFLS